MSLIGRLRAHVVDLTPLRVSRDFRLLFLGKSVSDFGDEIVAVAVPFQVYSITHSTLAVGLLGLCTLVPVLVSPILGGAMADAVERRRLMLTTHVLLTLMSLLMALNASLSHPRLWPLYVFDTLAAGVYTFNRPAVSTWPARLLPIELLPSSNALEAGFHTLAHIAAPLLAGALLVTIKPAGAFLVDSASFLAVIAAVWAMRPSPPAHDAPSLSWQAIADGFRFLKGKRNVQSVFAIDLNAMVFGFPEALFPAIAERLHRLHGGFGSGAVLGMLYAAPAAGAFLATAFSGGARHVRLQGRAIMIAVVVWGAAIVAFGFSRTLWLSIVTLAIAGAGDMVSGIFRMTILQSAVEDRIRGRLDGIGMAVWATGPSLGEFESGLVATLTSVPFAVISGGLLCIAGVGVLRLLVPGFARYDARDPEP
ncbi:MAG: MFS transporter [Actinomycetota bacterium]|nr:MFS transporter [Actinomycetota bacterium]